MPSLSLVLLPFSPPNWSSWHSKGILNLQPFVTNCLVAGNYLFVCLFIYLLISFSATSSAVIEFVALLRSITRINQAQWNSLIPFSRSCLLTLAHVPLTFSAQIQIESIKVWNCINTCRFRSTEQRRQRQGDMRKTRAGTRARLCDGGWRDYTSLQCTDVEVDIDVSALWIRVLRWT